MESGRAPGFSPADYAAWRRSRIGAITEGLEQAVVFDLAGPLAGRRVLDVGCGDGTYALGAFTRGARAWGVDASSSMIEAARRRAARRHAEVGLVVGEATALPFGAARFDVALAVTVLCFASDAGALLREIARVLAPGGRLVLGELGRWSSWAAWRRVRGGLGSAPWRSARFRSRDELARLAAEAGLAVESTRGAVFYPPWGGAARLLAPLDPWLGARTSFGAAFVALAATKPLTSNRSS
jgi:SAM-dependent methyltransferase